MKSQKHAGNSGLKYSPKNFEQFKLSLNVAFCRESPWFNKDPLKTIWGKKAF